MIIFKKNNKTKAAEPKKGSAVRHKGKRDLFKYRWQFRLVYFFIISVTLSASCLVLNLRFGKRIQGLTSDLYVSNVIQSTKESVEDGLEVVDVTEQIKPEKVTPPAISSRAPLIKEIKPLENKVVEPKIVTAVLYGHDEAGGGIDTTILVFVNLETLGIHMLSLPRDMELDFSDEARAELIYAGYTPHTNSYGKLTNWGRSLSPEVAEIVTREIARTFDISIDYYFGVDVNAFVDVIDIIGPIPFNVQQRMYYHNGERLLVDLQPGEQLLDGRQAEGLVRYRTYTMGDFDRTAVQRQFLEAVLSHIKSKGLGPSEILGLVKTVLENVDTNFINPLPYISVFDRLSDITVYSHMMPLELQHNSWRLNEDSFKFLEDVIAQVRKPKETASGKDELKQKVAGSYNTEK